MILAPTWCAACASGWTRRSAEAEARKLAVQDASNRAQQLAAAAGVKLGRLLSVTESSSPMRPVGVAMMAVPVEAGQLDVTVFVQARYAIE